MRFRLWGSAFLGFCAGERPFPHGLLRAMPPPPLHPPTGSAFAPSTVPRLRFCLLLDANPRNWFLADPHSSPTGEACPPVPGAPGVRGREGQLRPQRILGVIFRSRGYDSHCLKLLDHKDLSLSPCWPDGRCRQRRACLRTR
jgi:hypothetical protein